MLGELPPTPLLQRCNHLATRPELIPVAHHAAGGRLGGALGPLSVALISPQLRREATSSLPTAGFLVVLPYLPFPRLQRKLPWHLESSPTFLGRKAHRITESQHRLSIALKDLSSAKSSALGSTSEGAEH